MFKRRQFYELLSRMNEEKGKIQVVSGPRQVGKSTMVKQVLKEVNVPNLFVTADAVEKNDTEWIAGVWETARARLRFSQSQEFILAIDEVQKLKNWSEVVKREWDSDFYNDVNIKVILLGSSRLLLKDGLMESLAGRYELIRMGYWRYEEMSEAFGIGLNEYIFFGGYPGAVKFIKDETRWRRYIKDSIIEPVITKDILMTKTVYKPELMRRLLYLGCTYSGEELSLTKLLGQLQDKGNVSTLVNYLSTLNEAQILCGLHKYAVDNARKYNSVPKFFVYNTALLSALKGNTFEKTYTAPEQWGRWVESTVASHLLDEAVDEDYNVYYWRERNEEVDFVVVKDNQCVALEVKSGKKVYNTGLKEFARRFKPSRSYIIGTDGIPLKDFLTIAPRDLFE